MMLNQIEQKKQPSRRKFLKKAAKGGAAVAALSMLTSAPGLVTAKSKLLTPGTPFKIPQDPLFTSARNLASMIQAKKISSVELTEMYFKRIDEVNPQINAVVLQCKERALMEAKMADEMLAK